MRIGGAVVKKSGRIVSCQAFYKERRWVARGTAAWRVSRCDPPVDGGCPALMRPVPFVTIRRTLSTAPLTRGPCAVYDTHRASTSHRSRTRGRPQHAEIVLCGPSIPFHCTNLAILIVFLCPTVTIPAVRGCTAPSPAGLRGREKIGETLRRHPLAGRGFAAGGGAEPH